MNESWVEADQTGGTFLSGDPNWFYDDPTGQVWSMNWDISE